MNPSTHQALCAIGLAVALVVGAAGLALGDAPPTQGPACATIRSDARARGIAFDHIVYVENGCNVTLVCGVSTSVDPFPQHKLVVGPDEEKGVVTGKNRSHRKFEPRVACVRRARASSDISRDAAKPRAQLLHLERESEDL